ncbi:hypothetical protein [Streptosporangium sp. CA-115845]|uniref:hypothetical protein n=1 Tax=Streptosporangium sp. CA-115845 TaxID=3240071 RepID=UPI003D90A7CA
MTEGKKAASAAADHQGHIRICLSKGRAKAQYAIKGWNYLMPVAGRCAMLPATRPERGCELGPYRAEKLIQVSMFGVDA